MAEETQQTEKEAPAAAAPAKKRSPWLAVITVIVLSPVISFCVTQLILIPKIKGAVQEHQTAVADTSKKKEGSKGEKSDDKPAAFSYEFQGIVVNLSGTMGTRYLKVSFTVFSENQDLPKIMAENKPQLLDVALNVLSSRTLADLETAGAKNLVRNDLTTNFNQALNGNIVSQIYFSDFVVQ